MPSSSSSTARPSSMDNVLLRHCAMADMMVRALRWWIPPDIGQGRVKRKNVCVKSPVPALQTCRQRKSRATSWPLCPLTHLFPPAVLLLLDLGPLDSGWETLWAVRQVRPGIVVRGLDVVEARKLHNTISSWA